MGLNVNYPIEQAYLNGNAWNTIKEDANHIDQTSLSSNTCSINIRDADEGILLQNKTINPSTSSTVITADNGYDGINTLTINTTSDSIIPSNLKQGITIFGITGNMEEQQYSLILPTNPTITLQGGDQTIYITWETPTTEVPINHYNVYFSLNAPTKLSDMTKAGETSSTSYTLTGLTNDTTYYVAVESVRLDEYENASIWEVKNKDTKLYKILTGCYAGSNISTDGETWGSINSSGGNTIGLTYSKDRFISVGEYSSKYSYHGDTWVSMSGLNSTHTYSSVAHNDDDSLIATVGGTSITVGSAFYTTDAITWVVGSGFVGLGSKIKYINNKFYSCGTGTNYGAIINASEDGIVWTTQGYLNTGTSEEPKYGKGIAYGNNKFVAASDYFYYSVDGITWTKVSLTSTSVNEIDFINNKFIAVGGAGNVYYSTDGITWTNVYIGSNDLYAIRWCSDRIITVGKEISYYSFDGTNWVAMTGSLITGWPYRDVCDNN